jgi:hypothetical protein
MGGGGGAEDEEYLNDLLMIDTTSFRVGDVALKAVDEFI